MKLDSYSATFKNFPFPLHMLYSSPLTVSYCNFHFTEFEAASFASFLQDAINKIQRKTKTVLPIAMWSNYGCWNCKHLRCGSTKYCKSETANALDVGAQNTVNTHPFLVDFEVSFDNFLLCIQSFRRLRLAGCWKSNKKISHDNVKPSTLRFKMEWIWGQSPTYLSLCLQQPSSEPVLGPLYFFLKNNNNITSYNIDFPWKVEKFDCSKFTKIHPSAVFHRINQKYILHSRNFILHVANIPINNTVIQKSKWTE